MKIRNINILILLFFSVFKFKYFNRIYRKKYVRW